jgi:hypothetical protein
VRINAHKVGCRPSPYDAQGPSFRDESIREPHFGIDEIHNRNDEKDQPDHAKDGEDGPVVWVVELNRRGVAGEAARRHDHSNH